MFEDLGKTALKPRGSLTYSAPRELLVTQSIRGAFHSDGTLARDTIRRWGKGKRPPDVVPEKLPDQEVVQVCDQEVVWGGGMVSHYGHFLTETVSRLWPVVPEGELAGLPVVFTTLRPVPIVREWFDAFGLSLVELPPKGVVRFTRMIVPEPAWRLNCWITPEIRDVHLHARKGLTVPSSSPRRDVAWLSRSGLRRNRTAYDEGLLEWLLRKHVQIVQPETMTLAEQVAAFESSTAIAGVVGSAFHTMLLVLEPSDCLYLCPGRFQSAHIAQNYLLSTDSTFVHALAVAAMSSQKSFKPPFGHRLLIPETLRSLNATVLPGLLDDEPVAAFAYPEREAPRNLKGNIEDLARRALIDPLSLHVRMKLGAMFEAEGLDWCAIEQFAISADLTDDYLKAPYLAARLLARCGRHRDASELAERALAIDPKAEEMRKLLD